MFGLSKFDVAVFRAFSDFGLTMRDCIISGEGLER